MSPADRPQLSQLGVIGDPIAHSLSPELFDFLLKALELDYRYEAFHVPSESLAEFVDRARQMGIRGLNVTIPHKEAIIPLLDELTDDARALGAVNTLANEEGRWLGHNTDLAGFLRPLEPYQASLEGAHAVVLGAGGAARAVLHGLVRVGATAIAIANRTVERAQTLASELAASEAVPGNSRPSVEPVDLSETAAVAETIRDARLLVNATSVGMRPNPDITPLPEPSALHGELIVYDLVYRPLETRLLRQAREQGAPTIDGLGMLIHQAIEALRIWTHDEVEIPDSAIADLRGYLERKLLDEPSEGG